MSDLAPSRSPGRLALRRYLRNPRAVVSAVLLVVVAGATLVVPWISAHDYSEPNYDYIFGKPNRSNWMGADNLGRDLQVRLFLGGRVSFAVGFLATTVSVFIGVLYGAVAGFRGGRTDALMMRVVDVLYGLPLMLVIIIVMAFLRSRSVIHVFLVLGFFGWLTMARIVWGQVLSLKQREFVEAARALGARTFPIIFRHMIPNVLGPVIVYATLSVPSAILAESFISFLGLGVSEPETSWGLLISEGAGGLATGANFWWLWVFPGTALAVTLYCLNAVGDGLRDAVDVQQKQGA